MIELPESLQSHRHHIEFDKAAKLLLDKGGLTDEEVELISVFSELNHPTMFLPAEDLLQFNDYGQLQNEQDLEGFIKRLGCLVDKGADFELAFAHLAVAVARLGDKHKAGRVIRKGIDRHPESVVLKIIYAMNLGHTKKNIQALNNKLIPILNGEIPCCREQKTQAARVYLNFLLVAEELVEAVKFLEDFSTAIHGKRSALTYNLIELYLLGGEEEVKAEDILDAWFVDNLKFYEDCGIDPVHAMEVSEAEYPIYLLIKERFCKTHKEYCEFLEKLSEDEVSSRLNCIRTSWYSHPVESVIFQRLYFQTIKNKELRMFWQLLVVLTSIPVRFSVTNLIRNSVGPVLENFQCMLALQSKLILEWEDGDKRKGLAKDILDILECGPESFWFELWSRSSFDSVSNFIGELKDPAMKSYSEETYLEAWEVIGSTLNCCREYTEPYEVFSGLVPMGKVQRARIHRYYEVCPDSLTYGMCREYLDEYTEDISVWKILMVLMRSRGDYESAMNLWIEIDVNDIADKNESFYKLKAELEQRLAVARKVKKEKELAVASIPKKYDPGISLNLLKTSSRDLITFVALYEFFVEPATLVATPVLSKHFNLLPSEEDSEAYMTRIISSGSGYVDGYNEKCGLNGVVQLHIAPVLLNYAENISRESLLALWVCEIERRKEIDPDSFKRLISELLSEDLSSFFIECLEDNRINPGKINGKAAFADAVQTRDRTEVYRLINNAVRKTAADMTAGKLTGGYPAQSALRTFVNFNRKASEDKWDINRMERIGIYAPTSALVMTIDQYGWHILD